MCQFSVLMSVYHREEGAFLQQSLQSVFEQTCPPNEVILVKDGTLTDCLDAIIADFSSRYDTLKIISLPVNLGLGRALNKGLKECNYELVARMDSDDICKATRFEEQLKAFSKNPSLAIVGSWVDEFSDSIQNVTSQRKLPEYNKELVKFAAGRNPLNHPTVMFKKSIIEECGGYQDFYLFEDYYLWARIISANYQIYNIQKSLLFFRANTHMIARRGGWKYAVSEFKFLKKLKELKLLGTFSFIKNATIRFVVRIMPNKIRFVIYRKFLR